MAIGARITSENLSGKTATVTFVPYTGLTSGSTVNLGSKTIPFNNINEHPYGIYSLYFAEYDYTYTLTVTEPTLTSNSYVFISKMVGDTNNYGAAFLNFDDLTAEVMDMGVDSVFWNINDLYPITNKGYAYHFYGANDSNNHRVVFTNTNNEVVGDYSGYTSDWSYDYLDGRINIAWDQDGGVAYYSNGETAHTYNWDPSMYYFDIEWNDDATTADGSFMIILQTVNTNVYKSYSVSYDGVVSEIETWDTATNSKNYFQSTVHTFVPCITFDEVNSQYSDIKFRNSDGTLIGSAISLTGNTYNDYSYEQYGLNRFVIVFYNYNDVNVDYKIVHFDGETNLITESSHPRGTIFQNLNVNADDITWPEEEIPSALLIAFYSGGGYTNYGQFFTDCVLMYMLGSQTTFTTYTFANDESGKIINLNTVRKNINLRFTDNDLVIKFLSLTSTGQTITTTEVVANINNYFNDYSLNDLGCVSVLYPNGQESDPYVIYLKEPGTFETLSHSGNTSDNDGNNVYWFSSDNGSYYLNTTTTGFTQISGTYNTSRSDYSYSPIGLQGDSMVIYNYQVNPIPARIITSTSITDEVILPEHNGNYNIDMGKDYMLYVYGEVGTDLTIAKLYDRTMTLVKTVTTTSTSGWGNSTAVANRYLFDTNDNGVRTIHMVSPTLTPNATLSDNNYYDAPNDFVWWYD